MCGSSKVGWRGLRDHLSSEDRLSRHFTGSSADKANWVQFQKTCESEILKERTHSKVLKASQTVPGPNRAQQNGVSKTVPPSSVTPAASLKVAKNKKARMKYRKRKAQARKEKANPGATAAGKS